MRKDFFISQLKRIYVFKKSGEGKIRKKNILSLSGLCRCYFICPEIESLLHFVTGHKSINNLRGNDKNVFGAIRALFALLEPQRRCFSHLQKVSANAYFCSTLSICEL